jgi:peptidoglycan/LPS O-acetylase OafA/YrhL
MPIADRAETSAVPDPTGSLSQVSPYPGIAIKVIGALKGETTQGRLQNARVRAPSDLATQNNFDLIRLFAAVQVLIGHVLWHVGHYDGPMAGFLSVLPGVPIFFFTSGFLISGTYERNPDLRDYFRNRILRIYPALWASVFLSLIFITVLHRHVVGAPLLGWALMQATIFQDWNPPFLRTYGIGVANGSLWTIPVELSFYALTPIIYRLGRKHLDETLLAIMLVSFTLLQVLMVLAPNSFWQKAGLLTPLPWIGMFAGGALARRHLQSLRPFVEDKLLWWVGASLTVLALGHLVHAPFLFRANVNAVGLLHFVCLAGLVLSAACSSPGLANRVLKHNDISYGIYILHMPIINALLEAGLPSYLLSIGLTVLAAAGSWVLIEKRALRRKRAPGRRVVVESRVNI